MRGQLRLGRWLPFQAEQVLAPHHGFYWAARVAGLISGFDRYLDGQGELRWKLLGVVPVTQAEGPDVASSAVGRAAGEAMWLPTALLPRFGIEWQAADDRHVMARFGLDGRMKRTTPQTDPVSRDRLAASVPPKLDSFKGV